MGTLQLFRLALQLASLLLATLLLAIIASADHAVAGQFLAIDKCRIYGFPPHSRAYALCRMNVRASGRQVLALTPTSPPSIANIATSIRRRSFDAPDAAFSLVLLRQALLNAAMRACARARKASA